MHPPFEFTFIHATLIKIKVINLFLFIGSVAKSDASARGRQSCVTYLQYRDLNHMFTPVGFKQ